MMHIRLPRRAFLFSLPAAALAVSLVRVIGAAPPSSPATPRPSAGKETATLAAGCFWSMEAIFKQLKGVEKAEPGYAGGKVARPSYEQVESGDTGHAETVNVTFDPQVISYRDLLQVLLTVRNPTTRNRQGPDEGPQYRSVIFYRNEEQHRAAVETIRKITAAHLWPRPIVTAVTPFTNFYRAENYHLDYYRRHPNEPYCRYVIAPEIAEFRARFKTKLKP
jgi:peptide-methionine (S)-S-oxide reductase